ncbi:MAG: hypothetical protein CK423_07180 [Legionella sp.]|nr:MAG: hypothetical protein CK423_07180 [Legionella sp.]
MALPKSHLNKFLIAAMIACAVLAAICSFTWLIPTAIAATTAGLFFQIKKPGHRENFYQHAIDDNRNRSCDLHEMAEEAHQAENMLANF